MARKPGELRPSEAAERLGVHYDTIINWVGQANDPTRPARIPADAIRREHLTRRIYIQETAIKNLQTLGESLPPCDF